MKETNQKKCKLKSNLGLETQRRKLRKWYILENDSNKTLF